MDKAEAAYAQWCKEVVRLLLVHKDSSVFQEAIACSVSETGEEAPRLTNAVAFLGWFRGDEPLDSCNCLGDTPKQYVYFLFQEWALYGPGGE